ncbi:dTMP kinase [Fundidesulfovibrio butyratiphilus]
MFVTVEGVEGAGKSTQIGLMARWMESAGKSVLATRQPGGCELGLALRRILLDPATTDLDPTAELLLYLADRAQHVAQVIRPALAQGQAVLCDRYHDSTAAYQGHGRGLAAALRPDLRALATGGLEPDLTVLLDLDPETGLTRARNRNRQTASGADEGRFEALELDFHRRVRAGFLDLARNNPERFAVVDASGPPEAVFARVAPTLAALLAR